MNHYRHHSWYDRLPKLNHHTRRVIAVVLPWFSVGLGIMQIISAVTIWNLLGSTKSAVGLSALMQEYYNGGPLGYTPFEKAVMYFGIVVLSISAALFIGALEGLRSRRRYAWRMVQWALVADVVYALSQYFIFGHDLHDVFTSVIEAIVLLYLLSQVHDNFTRVRGGHHVAAHHPVHHPAQHPAHQQHPPQHVPAAQHPGHHPHNPHIHVG